MSPISNDRHGASEIPEAVEHWLRSLSDDAETGAPRRNRQQTLDPNELLERAARCYAIAGWADDACRMFVQLGDDRRAAAYFEQAGRWDQAGEYYRRVSDWQSAARCFIKSRRPDEAAACLRKAGDLIQAAWIWAHEVHRFRKAETVARKVKSESDTDRVAVQLILARCAAGTGKPAQAAKNFRRLIESLADLPPDMHHRRLCQWCLIVAEILKRPDFTALIHAAAVTAGLPEAHESWKRWAETVLGDTTGIPPKEDETHA